MRIVLFALVLSLSACAPDAPEADAADLDVSTEVADVIQPTALVAGPDTPVVTVFKSPTCGCCSMWVEHMEASGFTVDARDRDDMAVVKDSLGLPNDLASCHTGVVDGYVLEGHVPAQHVAQLLDERPEVLGLAVPGMPIGSPGMEVGDRVDPYDVLAVTPSGEAVVFASIPGTTRSN